MALTLALISGGSLPAAETAPSSTTVFNQPIEFPNLFLPEAYRKPGAPVPEAVLKRMRELTEQALASIFRRTTVPLSLNGKVERVQLFPLISRELHAIDSSARIMASGGVVRAGLTYLYDELRKGALRTPPQSPEEVLQAIIRAQEPIPGIDIRGVGSDFDILIRNDSGDITKLKGRIDDLLGQTLTEYGKDIGRGALRNSLFIVGDIREYETQTARSVKQGGSTIDFLAFDVDRARLIEPSQHPDTVRRFLRGILHYASPASAAVLEDPADTAIRGARALLELPWLQLDGEAALRSAFTRIGDDLANDILPSPRAAGQFSKAVRNSRYFGAHNRFHRGAPGSIEEHIRGVAQQLHVKTQKTALPEFVESQPLERKPVLPPEVEKLLVKPSEFLEKHTAGGKLLHGTPSMESALAILRQGLFISKDGQGTAAHGRGAYTSTDRAVAEFYAYPDGVVFELEVKNDPRLRILDWRAVDEQPVLRELEAKARQLGRDPFEYLARELGIDLIVKGGDLDVVLIENAEAIRFPKGMTPILQGLKTHYEKPGLRVVERADKLRSYREVARYAKAAGEIVSWEPTPAELRKLAEELLAADVPSWAFGLLSEVDHPRLVPLLLEAMPDRRSGADALKALFAHIRSPEISNGKVTYTVLKNAFKQLEKLPEGRLGGSLRQLSKLDHPYSFRLAKEYLAKDLPGTFSALMEAFAAQSDPAALKIVTDAAHFSPGADLAKVRTALDTILESRNAAFTPWLESELPHLRALAETGDAGLLASLEPIAFALCKDARLKEWWLSLPEDSRLERVVLAHAGKMDHGEARRFFSQISDVRFARRPQVVAAVRKEFDRFGRSGHDLTHQLLTKRDWAQALGPKEVLKKLVERESVDINNLLMAHDHFRTLPEAPDAVKAMITRFSHVGDAARTIFADPYWISHPRGLELLEHMIRVGTDGVKGTIASEALAAEPWARHPEGARLVRGFIDWAAGNEYKAWRMFEGIFGKSHWATHPEGLELLLEQLRKLPATDHVAKAFNTHVKVQKAWLRNEKFAQAFHGKMPDHAAFLQAMNAGLLDAAAHCTGTALGSLLRP